MGKAIARGSSGVVPVRRHGKRELRTTLEQLGLKPNKRLGQNFLVDPALLDVIPGDAQVKPGDRVLEIGPGMGGLTRRLLAEGAQVMAVEIDRGLVGFLRDSFASELSSGEFHLVEGDALAPEEKFHAAVEGWWAAGSQPRVVANLPYSISGPLLGRLASRPCGQSLLLLQKEVARKAVAGVGKEGYGPLAIRLSFRFRAKLGRSVPADVFWPKPNVNSSFLHLLPLPNVEKSEDALFRLVLSHAFGQRRKRLLPRLDKSYPEVASRMRALGISDNARPETISPAVWWEAVKGVPIPFA